MSTQNLPNVYLVFWNLDVKDAPHVETVRDQLRAVNLDETRAADVPDSTAFNRAAAELKTKYLDVKTFTSKESGRPRAQFDAITEEDGRLKRSFVGQYELTEDHGPTDIKGTPPAEFTTTYEHAKTHYVGADISKVIQQILTHDGLGAYSPRKNGGVYFVPVAPTAADLLTRIERFASALNVRFLVYDVPDTASQKAEIADAICDAYSTQIDAHAGAIAEYTHETRPGIIANRREAIQETYTAIGRLRPLMNGRYEVLRQTLGDLLTKLRNLETEQASRAEAEANAARVEGRRQIVNV